MQKRASISRNIMIKSSGGFFSSMLIVNPGGELYQEYDEQGNYYPDITATDPLTISPVITSAKSQGVLTPDSVDWYLNNVQLTFDASGACTTVGHEAYFRRDGADLIVIGNYAAINNNASVPLKMVAHKGTDDITDCILAEAVPYRGLNAMKVAICAGDTKNFTLRSQNDSVILKAGVLKGGTWTYNVASYTYIWEKADPTNPDVWTKVQEAKGQGGTLTVNASDVDTYANYRVKVYSDAPTGWLSSMTAGSVAGGGTAKPASAPANQAAGQVAKKLYLIGSDVAGVMDASDPLDILLAVKINRTGTGAEEDIQALDLEDSLPANAYLLFTPTLVERGKTTSVGSTTWLNGILTDPTGVQTRNIIPSEGKYKVLMSDFGGKIGGHTIIITGELS